jgi:hypothetical protein
VMSTRVAFCPILGSYDLALPVADLHPALMMLICDYHRQRPCARRRWQRDRLRSRLKIREPTCHDTAIPAITAALR